MTDPNQCQAPLAQLTVEAALHASQLWTDIFTVAAYAMASCCIFGTIRRGVAEEKGENSASGVAKQLGIFVVFAIMFYSLESYAFYRTPYYTYDQGFRDLVPRLPLAKWLPANFLTAVQNQCTQRVGGYPSSIPVSVVLFEASLAYCAMWTARRLNGKLWTQPLLAGLVLVNVDAMLDPIAAQTHDCITERLIFEPHASGIGLWHWFVPIHAADLFHSAGSAKKVSVHCLATWFGVPAFNFVAWWAGPVVLVSAVILFSHVIVPSIWRRRGRRISTGAWKTSPWWHIAVWIILVLAVVVMVIAAPNVDLSKGWQSAITLACVLLSLGLFFGQFGDYKTTKHFDATLTTPVAAALLLPAIAVIARGQAFAEPLLMPVVVVSVAMGLWLAWLPYRNALKKIARFIGQIDRFVRFHYFGFTAMLVMFGGALSRPDPHFVVVVGLFAVAVCFHVYSYVLNDIVDLKLDAKVVSRRHDPLVSGRVQMRTAAGLVGLMVPLAAAATLLLVNANPDGRRFSCSSFAALAAAFGLMTVYNVWGKKYRRPMVTDGVEGVAWGLLALFGVLATGDAETCLENLWGIATLFSCGALFIFLINGIHGGLRDVANDFANGKHTTALSLGATPNTITGGVTSSGMIALFAFSVHTAFFGVLLAFVAWGGPSFVVPGSVMIGIIGVLWAVDIGILWQVVRPESAHRNAWISTHVFTVLLPPLLVFLCDKRPGSTFKWGVALTFFVPLVVRQPVLDAFIQVVYERDWKGVRKAYGRAGDVVYGRSAATVEPPDEGRVKEKASTPEDLALAEGSGPERCDNLSLDEAGLR